MQERILQVLNGMGSGGVEKYVLDLFRYIDCEKFIFDFLIRKCSKEAKDFIESYGGKVYFMLPITAPKKKRFREMDDFFAEHKEYKIVHIHKVSIDEMEVLKTAKKSGVPTVILHSHNANAKKLKRKLLHLWYRPKIRGMDMERFACSPFAGKWMFGDQPYSFIHNGISVQQFCFNEQTREEVRKELGIENQYVWGHVGRFCKAKNQTFILSLFKKTLQKNPNCILLFLGEGEDLEKIKRRAKRLGISEKVRFLGVRKDVERFLCAMDIFLFPSLHEGFALSLLEAQCSGVRCVCNNGIESGKLTDRVQKISLKDKKGWLQAIQCSMQSVDRASYAEVIRAKGFDLFDTVRDMQTFYEQKSLLKRE